MDARSLSSRSRRFVPAALLSALAAASLVHGCGPDRPAEDANGAKGAEDAGGARDAGSAAPEPAGASVQGYLIADLGTPESRALSLPGLRVSLKQATKEGVVAAAVTDLEGIFLFSDVGAGDYEVCWEGAGWLSACATEVVHVQNRPLALVQMRVSPDRRPGPDGAPATVVWGRVSLADGSIPGRIDPFFEVEDVPVVRVQGLDTPVTVSASGTFVAAGVPATSKGVSAVSGSEATTATRKADAATASAPLAPMALVSTDHPPIIESVGAYLNDRPVTRAGASATLSLRAKVRDADGDAVRVQWRPGGGDGTCEPSAWGAAMSGEWKLPAVPGVHTVYLMARDGRGGYATGRVDVAVTADEAAAVAGASAPAPAAVCQRIPRCEGCPDWQAHPRSPFFTRMTGKKELAEAYYAAVDPAGERKSLGAFWAVNGFDESGAGGIRASYLNHGDLGLGRDLHCKTTGPAGKGLACYVTNYGCFDQAPGNAELAERADRSQAAATVAMEYSPSLPVEKSVSFFVYKGGVAEAERVPGADLDGYGEKFVPHLCGNCHGGHPDGGGREVAFPKFRELDLAALRFTRGREYGGLTDEELGKFRAMNEMVKGTLPQGNLIRRNIEGWYASGANRPDYTWTPEDWKTAEPQTEKLYHEVVAPYCRTCHIALDTYPFDSFADAFSSRRDAIAERVCFDRLRAMPHSATTYNNFWRSPTARQALAGFRAEGWEPLGTCPTPN